MNPKTEIPYKKCNNSKKEKWKDIFSNPIHNSQRDFIHPIYNNWSEKYIKTLLNKFIENWDGKEKIEYNTFGNNFTFNRLLIENIIKDPSIITEKNKYTFLEPGTFKYFLNHKPELLLTSEQFFEKIYKIDSDLNKDIKTNGYDHRNIIHIKGPYYKIFLKNIENLEKNKKNTSNTIKKIKNKLLYIKLNVSKY